MENNNIVRLANSSDQSVWDKLVSHPLQSWAWGEFRAWLGIDVVRLIEEANGKPRSVYQLTFHKIPYTPFTIGYFPKGPQPTSDMITQLTQIGRDKNSIFIQIEPNVPKSTPNYQLPTPNLYPSHHPLFTKYTFILDLTKPEEELIKNLHPKTRYNLKIASKHDVKISIDSSPDQFVEYLQLVHTTTERQGFYAHNLEYHQKMWQVMRQANIAKLCTASYQGKILAAWIIFTWGNTLYYPYGSSSRDHREVMAPTLLLWEISRWGRENGYRQFDLWGALGPHPDPNDPWYGFHRFKAGFTPKLIEFIGSFDLIINPTFYSLYKIADLIRWKLLKR